MLNLILGAQKSKYLLTIHLLSPKLFKNSYQAELKSGLDFFLKNYSFKTINGLLIKLPPDTIRKIYEPLLKCVVGIEIWLTLLFSTS